jgi:hypothetical protein
MLKHCLPGDKKSRPPGLKGHSERSVFLKKAL